MENKYYLPEISDIRVGYEYLLLTNEFSEENPQEQIIKDFKDIWIAIHNIDNIRTSFLTKEPIEKEEWIIQEEIDNPEGNTYWGLFKKDEYELRFWREANYIEILDNFDDPLFQGKCPSINEFRYIIKLLDI